MMFCQKPNPMRTFFCIVLVFFYLTTGTSHGQAQTQKLDSVIHEAWDYANNAWYSYLRGIETYDNHGNDILSILERRGGIDSPWTNETKVERTFDIFGNKITDIQSGWASAGWFFQIKNYYFYDGAGNSILQFYSQYDTVANQWIPYNKYEDFYDDDNRNIRHIIYWYDTEKANYVPEYKTDNSYDDLGNITTSITYIWDLTASRWNNNGKTEYIRNANHSITLVTHYIFYKGNWRKHGEETMTYAKSGELIKSVWIGYKIETGTLYAATKLEYTYNGDGLPDILITSTLSTRQLSWILYSKFVYEYDGQRRMISEQRNVRLNKTWIPFEKHDYEFDGNDNCTLHATSFWDTDAGDWERSEDIHYYFGGHIFVSSPSFSVSKSIVFPNPAHGYVIFDFEGNVAGELELFDLNGHRVMGCRISPGEIVSLDNIAKGLYFYRLQTGSLMTTGKLIIE